jgi:hypothetical protein
MLTVADAKAWCLACRSAKGIADYPTTSPESEAAPFIVGIQFQVTGATTPGLLLLGSQAGPEAVKLL